jgi:hypothetical protein
VDPLATKLDLHAIAEEEIFYPQLLRRGTEDPEEATLDAIGDHNDIRDGVHAAETHTVGTPEWWAAVTAAREANDEHMAEEEREGIADFRANAPAGLREALGRQFARLFEQHPTTDGVNVSDKNPERYVETIEREIAQTGAGDGSLGIGSLKGQAPAMTATDHLLRDLAPSRRGPGKRSSRRPVPGSRRSSPRAG